MAAPRKDRCGTRTHRRAGLEPEGSPVANGDTVGLTPLGRALMDALREDDRYRDIIRDPFGEDPAGAG